MIQAGDGCVNLRLWKRERDCKSPAFVWGAQGVDQRVAVLLKARAHV